MTHMPDVNVRKMLKERAPELGEEIEKMTFGEIKDPEISIKEDLAILRASPLLPKDVNILGFKLDIHNGLLSQVE